MYSIESTHREGGKRWQTHPLCKYPFRVAKSRKLRPLNNLTTTIHQYILMSNLVLEKQNPP